MGDKTAIQWTDASWTPIRARNLKTGKVGWHCEHVTPGCEKCYAEGLNKYIGTGLPFKPGHRKDIEIFLDEKMLTQPLRWKKPRMIFVCSMTDLFADFVKDEWIDRIFAVMALCPQHQFQVLTKRAERMRDYFTKPHSAPNLSLWQSGACWAVDDLVPSRTDQSRRARDQLLRGPLPNVWLGVSAEDQARADERIPLLLQTPAAIRFISAEPLIGPIDFRHLPFTSGDPRHKQDAFTGEALMYGTGVNGNPDITVRMTEPKLAKLDWVIIGGESGPKARPFDTDWARIILKQCEFAGVAAFMKQIGSLPYSDGRPLHSSTPLRDKGGDPTRWAPELRVRQMPRMPT